MTPEDTGELPESISVFPTSNQLVLDTALKDILIYTRGTLHADTLLLTQQFKQYVWALGYRVD